MQSHALESPTHVRRFPKLYRNLHIMVIVSFISLAVTGMTLKSATRRGQGAVAPARRLEAAGFIHRVAATVTFSYFAIHLFDLFRRKRESGSRGSVSSPARAGCCQVPRT
jgi:cytochrome b subunit of formate dehydrogenase